ncbi:MAG: MFS transporter [Promicromonosporaceae bacterium]|nr:MFS transporter [Promicromonosporaceae bacterium]
MPKAASLVATARGLTGNPRACVYTEPMWGISMALVLPYASVFMFALGITDQQIGLLTTIGMISQVFFGIAGGILTDKLGRRWATAIFDVTAWVIPALIWAVAQNFWYFLFASIINGSLQVTWNSWDALMIEDADREQIPRIYALVRIAADCSAFFMPIAALLVSRYGLIHAVRILYVNAAIVMIAKVVVLFLVSRETRTGTIRMAATRGVPIRTLLGEYRGVLGRLILRKRGARFSLAIMAVVAAVSGVVAAFWPLFVTGHLGVPDTLLPFFPMVRSVLSIIFFFTLVPRLTAAVDLKVPAILGFGIFLAGQIVLVTIPIGPDGEAGLLVYGLLGLSLILDSFGAATAFMLSESLFALHADVGERSRVMALQRPAVMLAAAPFGWIAGWLSSQGRAFPFVLTAILLAIGLALVAFRWVPTVRDDAAQPTVPAAT